MEEEGELVCDVENSARLPEISLIFDNEEDLGGSMRRRRRKMLVCDFQTSARSAEISDSEKEEDEQEEDEEEKLGAERCRKST